MSLYYALGRAMLLYLILLSLEGVLLPSPSVQANVISSSAESSDAQQCEVDANGATVCKGPTTTTASSIKEHVAVRTDADDVECIDCHVPKGANNEGKPIEAKLGDCKDRHEMCVTNSKNGECDRNPGWMIVNCPHSCNKCHLLDPKKRCNRAHLNISEAPIYSPGSLDSMFGSIEAKFGKKYGINVLSRAPWVVTFDNFLSDREVKALIKTVEGSWERSTDTGKVNEYGETGRVLSKGRTSSNAWCRSRCEGHPDVKSVMAKIEEITGIPRENSESFQILRYEPGQFYNTHHDMAPHQNNLACGPRILTFFLYLSDVEEGGETAFPQLNIDVEPKRGRALLWPSVLDDDLQAQDGRTHHGAKPVIKGIKYAANAWIHLFNFQQANLWGCTGTFDVI